MDLQLKKLKCLSGSTLKIIAMVSMLVDHTAAFFLTYARPLYHGGTEAFCHAEEVYQIMRQIGRTAFPIFCFLLVEGFFHTHSRVGYLKRMVIFSLLSEIPFDLAIQGRMISLKYQNVILTLTIGLLMMMVLDQISRKMGELLREPKLHSLSLLKGCIAYIAAGMFFVVLGELVHCDYGGKGIVLILILYCLRNQRIYACIVGYLSFLWEAFCFPAFLLISLYDGRRGLKLKYFFYLFYPIHILILYFLKIIVWG